MNFDKILYINDRLNTIQIYLNRILSLNNETFLKKILKYLVINISNHTLYAY